MGALVWQWCAPVNLRSTHVYLTCTKAWHCPWSVCFPRLCLIKKIAFCSWNSLLLAKTIKWGDMTEFYQGHDQLPKMIIFILGTLHCRVEQGHGKCHSWFDLLNYDLSTRWDWSSANWPYFSKAETWKRFQIPPRCTGDFNVCIFHIYLHNIYFISIYVSLSSFWRRVGYDNESMV